MADIPEIKMAERCATCAFRPGTPANLSYITQTKAKLCAMIGEPFLCHESPIDAWCAGVSGIVESLWKRGELLQEPKWKRELYALVNECICEVEDGADADDAFAKVYRFMGMEPMKAADIEAAVTRKETAVGR